MLIKIIHMSFGVLTLLLFATRAFMGLRSPNGRLTASKEKFFKIALHAGYTVLVLCGLWLLVQLPNVYPHWIIAKLVLFAVALSASTKAFKTTATRAQLKSGVFVASIAYVAIVWLIIAKPGGVLVTKAPATDPAVSQIAATPSP